MPIGESPVGSLPNDPYIQKEFFEPEVMTKVARRVAPLIDWLPRVEADAEAIVAIREKYSASSDPKKKYPAIHVAGTRFPRVTISGLEEISTVIAEEGLEFAISPRTRRWAVNIVELDKTYQRVGYWMADYLAMKLFINLKAFVTQEQAGMAFRDRTVVKWDAASGQNPILDMKLMQKDMENFDNGFSVSDFYVHYNNFDELTTWLIDLDIDIDTRRNLYGMPEPDADSIYIPLLGATIHKVRYGLDEGGILALDADNRPATLYYGRNPEFAPAGSWQTETEETIENDLGLHSFQYYENKSHDVITQIWFEHGFLVTEPKAGIYCAPGAYGI